MASVITIQGHSIIKYSMKQSELLGKQRMISTLIQFSSSDAHRITQSELKMLLHSWCTSFRSRLIPSHILLMGLAIDSMIHWYLFSSYYKACLWLCCFLILFPFSLFFFILFCFVFRSSGCTLYLLNSSQLC